MDRFIAFDIETTSFYYKKFKIQYGQIYSVTNPCNDEILYGFKIQYGQIYSAIMSEIVSITTYLKSNMDRFIAVLGM